MRLLWSPFLIHFRWYRQAIPLLAADLLASMKLPMTMIARLSAAVSVKESQRDSKCHRDATSKNEMKRDEICKVHYQNWVHRLNGFDGRGFCCSCR